MKKASIALLILSVLAGIICLVGIGFFLYRHFVTNRISDWGGMENPDYTGYVRDVDSDESTDLTQSILQEEDHGTV